MKATYLLICFLAAAVFPSFVWAQDAGVGRFSLDLGYAILGGAGNDPVKLAQAKKQTEPFAVAFCGFRVLKLIEIPYDQFGGAQIGVCRAVINYYDTSIDATLKSMATRSNAPRTMVEVTAAERTIISKLLTEKYTHKYILGIDAGNIRPADPVDTWKFTLGANMGALSARLTQWDAFAVGSKFDPHVAKSIAALQAEVDRTPAAASPALIKNLKTVLTYKDKTTFTEAERSAIVEAFKSALAATIKFADLTTARTAVVPSETSGPVTSISQLSDVKASDYFYDDLQNLIERYGITGLSVQGKFNGGQNLTRGDFDAIVNSALLQMLNIVAGSDIPAARHPQALGSDCPPPGAALRGDEINGYLRCMFRSNSKPQPVTAAPVIRGQFVSLLANALDANAAFIENYFDDSEVRREVSESYRSKAAPVNGKRRDPVINLSKAILIDPSNVNAYLDRGSLYHSAEERQKAFADFDKARDLVEDAQMEPKRKNALSHTLSIYARTL